MLGRANIISSALRAVSQAVPNSGKGVVNPLPPKEPLVTFKDGTFSSSSKRDIVNSLPSSGNLRITSGIGVSTHVRYRYEHKDEWMMEHRTKTEMLPGYNSKNVDLKVCHTDLKVPTEEFDYYRRSSTLDPNANAKDTFEARNSFTYMSLAAAIALGAVSTKYVARFYIGILSPSKAVLDMDKVEISLDKVPEGKSVTFKWRGKPLFIKHRTAEEINREATVDLSILRDPEHDKDRLQDPKWLIVIGVCTHLGCVPIADSGDFGGYYCPCHGSHYDASGRIRKGPAPLNLEVPHYVFTEPGMVLVG